MILLADKLVLVEIQYILVVRPVIPIFEHTLVAEAHRYNYWETPTWCSCFISSDLAWLSKWYLLRARRDLPQFGGSANLKIEPSNWFPGSLLLDKYIASGFTRCSRLWRWTWHQALSSWVISLSTLCTCSSLLCYYCFWFPWSCGSSRRVRISPSLPYIQRWSQHFSKFSIFTFRVCSAFCWVVIGTHLRLEVGASLRHLFQIHPHLLW